MTLLAIFRNAHYSFLALIVATLAFFSVTIFSQLRLLIGIIPDGGVTLSEKVSIILAISYGAITEITFNSLLTAVIAALFSISVAGITYYFRLYKATSVSAVSAFSAGGVVSGIVALGCASCGSLIVGFLASFFSASSLLIFIPYQSTVLGIISILMLLASLYLLDRKLRSASEELTL